MTFSSPELIITKVKVHNLESIHYKYERPVTITYSYKDKTIVSFSRTGLKSTPPLYWPPYFLG